jgi:hypothetical protein
MPVKHGYGRKAKGSWRHPEIDGGKGLPRRSGARN